MVESDQNDTPIHATTQEVVNDISWMGMKSTMIEIQHLRTKQALEVN